MNDLHILDIPKMYSEIERKTKEIGFSMSSDLHIGSLLKTLVTSKPKSNILELGTGTGLALSWIISGMDTESHVISIDNDPVLVEVAKAHFEKDKRVQLLCVDGTQWIKNYQGEKFDLIFADAWPGKYSEIDEILECVANGGFYIIDDMTFEPNWPEGHQELVHTLIDYLEQRKDINLTKMNWSTGVIIAAKNK